MGDGYCDDLTNNKECNYDGGDCCGPNPQTMFCIICQCIAEGDDIIGAGCYELR